MMSAAARRQQHRAWRGPSLRLGSQNVRSLAIMSDPTKFKQLLRHWRLLRWDVVAVQESKTTPAAVQRLITAAAATARGHPGWSVWWSHGPPGIDDRPTAGVAIFVSRAALARGLVISNEWQPPAGAEGRMLGLRLAWGGHALRFLSIYMPSDSSTAQRAFIRGHLQAAAALAQTDGPGVRQVWAGDWNFVEHAGLDRLTLRAPAGGAAQSEASVAREWRGEWRQQLPAPLVDAFRSRCPNSHNYTHFSACGAARLDRFYISEGLLQWVVGLRAGEHLEGAQGAMLSDHRPLSLCLVACQASPAASRAAARLRLRFFGNRDLTAQFKNQLEVLVAQAPPDPTALQEWWPLFKRRLHSLGRRMNQAAQRSLPPSVEAAWRALEAAYQRADAGDAAAIVEVTMRRAELAEATAAALASSAAQQRHAWITQGERPCPALTAKLRPPTADRTVTALRASNGTLVESPAGCAQLLAKSYSRTCAQQTIDPMAQEEVLLGLDGGPRPSEAEAAALGAAAVTAVEVEQAMRRMKAGKAPGLDGLPLELWRRFSDVLGPLLASHFSAIGTARHASPAFLEGVLSVSYKRGPRSDPASYRPLQLLNTDYRILAKVLANRLGKLLPKLIDPEQCGFVKGRSIGEAIHLLQLLPHLLQREGRWAVAVLMDIAKAYDTVDRDFLLRAVERCGLGEGFATWVRLLLTNTRTCARVGASLSAAEQVLAGVRQGCPLAPLLYLLVAQALLRLLKRRGFGLLVGARLHTASLFADDCTTLLEASSMSELEAKLMEFLSTLDVFRLASGQQLSLPKTMALPLGRLPADLPTELCGIQLVQQARVLGVVLQAGSGAATVDWQTLAASVKASLTKLAGQELSIFGRALGSSSYAISRLLTAAEFGGLPPPMVLADLQAAIGKLVDSGTAPQDSGRRFTGVRAELVVGRPSEGGFGALPLVPHLHARHAAWLCRLITSDGKAPWAAVATALLQLIQPGLTPLGLLAYASTPTAIALLPDPLRRWREGMQQLPAVQLLPVTEDAEAAAEGDPGALQPTAAAQPAAAAGAAAPDLPHLSLLGIHAALPIMYSPLVQRPAAEGGGCLATTHSNLMHWPMEVSTLGQLVRLRARVRGLERTADGRQQQQLTRAAWQQAATPILGHAMVMLCLGDPALPPGESAMRWLSDALACVPGRWVSRASQENCLAQRSALQLPCAAEVEKYLACRLGWRRDNRAVSLAHFRVRHGTEWQLGSLQQQRSAEKLQPFVRQALTGTPAGPLPTSQLAAGESQLAAMFKRAWRLPCDNKVKETFWRLALNGLPTAQRQRAQWPCGCGTPGPDRGHHCWTCPVARAVVASVEAQLPAASRPLQQQHLWLGISPAAVHEGVWAAVCLAAVAAMDYGRRLMAARLLQVPADPSDPQQRRLVVTAEGRLGLAAPATPQPQAPGPALAAAAAVAAERRLWELIQDFSASAPAAWHASVAAGHPFLRWAEEPPGWQVVRPATAPA